MLDEFVPVGVFDSLDSELLWEKCILQSPDDPISLWEKESLSLAKISPEKPSQEPITERNRPSASNPLQKGQPPFLPSPVSFFSLPMNEFARLDSSLPMDVFQSVESEMLWDQICKEHPENPYREWYKRKAVVDSKEM